MKRTFLCVVAALFVASTLMFSVDAYAKGSSGGGFSSGGGRSSGGFSSGRSSSSGGFSSGSKSSSGGFSSGSKSSSSGSKSSSGSGWFGGSKSSKSTPASPAPSAPKSSGGFSSGGKSTPSKPAATTAPKSGFSGSSSSVSSASSKPAISGNRLAGTTTVSKKADIAAYKQAASSGKAFKTTAEAEKTFKANADKEFPSKFSSEPTTRPSYIPSTYAYNGTSIPVVYNAGYGGYGYMDPLTNMFVLYSVASMASSHDHEVLMAKSGYYVGEPPRSSSAGTILGIFLAFVVVAVIIFVVMTIFNGSKNYA